MTTNQNPLPTSITASAAPAKLSPADSLRVYHHIRKMPSGSERGAALAAYMREQAGLGGQ